MLVFSILKFKTEALDREMVAECNVRRKSCYVSNSGSIIINHVNMSSVKQCKESLSPKDEGFQLLVLPSWLSGP